MPLVPIGDKWPSPADQARLSRYEVYRKYFEGEHLDAFRYLGACNEDGGSIQRKIYIIQNFPGLISRKFSDFLVGEPPTFSVSKEEDGEDLDLAPVVQEASEVAEDPGPTTDPTQAMLQHTLKHLVRKNNLIAVIGETQMTASSRGDMVFRIRDNGTRIIIEEVAPHSYFAVQSRHNKREVLGEAIMWLVDYGAGNWYLIAEHHLPGKIYTEAYRCSKPGDDGCVSIQGRVGLQEAFGDEPAPPDEQKTGIDNRPLLWHIPNFRQGSEFWGIADYKDLAPIFEAMNNRLSKIDSYLDKHAGPKLVGYPGMADAENNVKASANYFEPGDPETAKSLPRYVTWEGQMTAAFKEIDVLMARLCQLAEVAPEIIGLTIARTIESAKALRLLCVPTTSKVNRKRQLIDNPLKDVLWTALMLSHIRYQTPSPRGYGIDIVWQDGLPEDYGESVISEAARVGAGLVSKETAICRLDRVTPQQAKQELAQIASEQAMTAAAPLRETPGLTGEGNTDVRNQQQSGDPGQQPSTDSGNPGDAANAALSGS